MSSTNFEQAGWASEAFKPVTGKTVVMFRTVQKKDSFQTEKQQRPVFREVVHIVKIPADQFLRIDRPVREADKEEFPDEWARWERTRETRVLGTPLENWHSVTDTQKAEFKAMGVSTIEQFAGLPDSWGSKVMGFLELRHKAKVFVESGKDAELVAKIREEANEKVTAMEAKMAEMQAQLASLMEARRGPGRPPKDS